MVFLLGHKGGQPSKLTASYWNYSIALTPEDALTEKAESFVLAIPADYAEKVVASIQKALQSLRQSN